MLDRLWASWRSRYVTGQENQRNDPRDGEGTLFERILASGESDEDAGVVFRGQAVSVILNAYPYGSGHLLVIPNRGVERLAELSADEARELWDTVQHTVGVLERVYEPGGVNVGLNQGRAAGAGIPEHLHVHVLPRWDGDTNFMTSIAETRVLPESLDETARRVRAHWDDGQ